MRGGQHGTSIILASFFIALMLLIVPLPDHLASGRPQIAMLVLIYWVLYLPHRIGVATGWCVGLLMDVLVGGVLGEYALGMALIAYLTYRLHARVRMVPVFQQMFTVFLMVGGAQFLAYFVNMLNGSPYKFHSQWVSILTTTLCWPLVFLILNRVQSNCAIE